MRAIIDGKQYDTDTAELISTFGMGNPSDFRHVREGLYKTSKGKFFLDGEGGPLSAYAQSIAMNEWIGGRKLVPLSNSEALRWCEDHADPETTQEHFTVEEA